MNVCNLEKTEVILGMLQLAVYIEDRNRVQDRLGVQSLRVDEALVYETSYGSIIQKSFHGVELAYIHGTQFYSELQYYKQPLTDL